jgi:neutral amino acid transport system permease protein
MEAGTLSATGERDSALARLRVFAGRRPELVAFSIIGLIAVALIIGEGLQPFGQTSVNGLVSGSYFALGAVGLTLVYGILKLVNFAHGDMLTFGAYIGFAFNVSIGLPLVVALVVAIAATAAVGVFLELAMWRPMRRKRAGMLQLLLMAIGLAFVLRNVVQFIWGTESRSLDVDVTSAISFIDLRIGETQLIVLITGVVVLTLVGLMLSQTSLGRQMRALSDNLDLAETTGIDTGRIIVITWVFAAGLAGLAGVMVVAATNALSPNTGFFLLLSLFAATVLGGIGNPYGALLGGLVIGLSQEWATLLIEARWKAAVSFLVLILVLIIRPQGILGRARTI